MSFPFGTISYLRRRYLYMCIVSVALDFLQPGPHSFKLTGDFPLVLFDLREGVVETVFHISLGVLAILIDTLMDIPILFRTVLFTGQALGGPIFSQEKTQQRKTEYSCKQSNRLIIRHVQHLFL
jgi:hypothetical protein